MYFSFNRNINRNFAKQPPQKLFRCSGCFKRIYSVKYFQGKLYEQTCSENKKLDLTTLYPHKKPWTIIGENELMQSIKHSLSSFSAKIFSLAEETLDDHSIYHISAKDYETFSNGCTKIINDIEQQIEKEKEKITTFYLHITNAPAVSHALSTDN